MDATIMIQEKDTGLSSDHPILIHDNLELFQPTDHDTATSASATTPSLSPSPSSSHTALIILNNAIDSDVFPMLYRLSRIRIYADGGSNRVYDTYVNNTSSASTSSTVTANHHHDVNNNSSNGILTNSHATSVPRDPYLPTVLVGDFDSIRSDVRHYYESVQHIPTIYDPDVDATDFRKPTLMSLL